MNDDERMQFFYEMFHSSLARLGPGSEASTLEALNTVLAAKARDEPSGTNKPLRILDLGCGTGPQSLVLARHVDGRILATDLQQANIDALRARAEAQGVAGKIETRVQDMRTLEFPEGSFDLIWCEGALFCMGVREGLARCRDWLSPGGFFAITELCYLQPDAPLECRRFIEGAYPVITDVETNLSAMRDCGYTVIDHFESPVSDWLDEFYNPLERRLDMLRERYAGDAERLDLIQGIQKEIDNYRAYSAYYGYEFYILRR
jgi:cyclopropane fatty-acyl-phospholipid synthase-like methyltransferase